MANIKMRPVSAKRLRIVFFAALAIATTVEFLQDVPAPYRWMHPAGEVLLNLGFAVSAAYIFNYFLTELPERRRASVALRLSSSALESIAMKPSLYFTACLQRDGVVLTRDVTERDEMIELVRKQVVRRKSEDEPPALYVAVLRKLLRDIDKSFTSISPYLEGLPPDLAVEVVRYKENFANIEMYLRAGFTLQAFFRPLDFGREFANILIRNVDDKAFRDLLKCYGNTYVIAERTAADFGYYETHYNGENFLKLYDNPIGAMLSELEDQLRLQAEKDSEGSANQMRASDSQNDSLRTFGQVTISIVRRAVQDTRKAWTAHKSAKR